MKRSKYNNGWKTIAIILQMVFLIVMIVTFSLLLSLYGRSMLSFTDIGEGSFFSYTNVGLAVGIVSAICFVLSMIYITIATGRNGEGDRIHLFRLDYVPTEIHFLLLLLFVMALVTFCGKLGSKEWEISSFIILAGTIVFLSDAVILALYLSLVRKIKSETFLSCSLTSYTVHSLKDGIRKQQLVKRGIIQFFAAACYCLAFAWLTFSWKSAFGAIGLFIAFVWLAVYFLRQAIQRKKILEGIEKISGGDLSHKFQIMEFTGDYADLAEKINDIGDGLHNAVEENLKSERLKTELITNVSHDIKTPLTSIINYINLIKMEGIENEKVENYIGILERKSQRLKQLTEDLVEVSRITSGSITLDMQPINMVELICQTGGEFNEIFEDLGLTVITRLPNEPVMILADGNRIWRIVQNLYNNVAKYALKDTRVYVELKEKEGYGHFCIKDISAQEIKKMPQDLSERFVQGDESRGTEGSGLGLSIAKNLANLMGGTFEIELEGDLFIASIAFPLINP